MDIYLKNPSEKECPSVSDLTYSDIGFDDMIQQQQEQRIQAQRQKHSFDYDEDVGHAAAEEMMNAAENDDEEKDASQAELSQWRLGHMRNLDGGMEEEEETHKQREDQNAAKDAEEKENTQHLTVKSYEVLEKKSEQQFLFQMHEQGKNLSALEEEDEEQALLSTSSSSSSSSFYEYGNMNKMNVRSDHAAPADHGLMEDEVHQEANSEDKYLQGTRTPEQNQQQQKQPEKPLLGVLQQKQPNPKDKCQLLCESDTKTVCSISEEKSEQQKQHEMENEENAPQEESRNEQLSRQSSSSSASGDLSLSSSCSESCSSSSCSESCSSSSCSESSFSNSCGLHDKKNFGGGKQQQQNVHWSGNRRDLSAKCLPGKNEPAKTIDIELQHQNQQRNNIPATTKASLLPATSNDPSDDVIMEIMQLKLELAQLKSKADEQSMLNLRLSKEQNRLEIANEAHQEQNSSLSQQNAQLSSEIDAYKEAHSSLQTELIRISTERDVFKNDVKAQHHKIDQLKVEGEQLTIVISKLKEKNLSVQNEKETWENRHRTVYQERDELQEDARETSVVMSHMREQANNSSIERDSLLRKVKTLEAERDQMQLVSLEVCSERDTLRMESEKLSANNDEMSRKLEAIFAANAAAGNGKFFERFARRKDRVDAIFTSCIAKSSGVGHFVHKPRPGQWGFRGRENERYSGVNFGRKSPRPSVSETSPEFHDDEPLVPLHPHVVLKPCPKKL